MSLSIEAFLPYLICYTLFSYALLRFMRSGVLLLVLNLLFLGYFFDLAQMALLTGYCVFGYAATMLLRRSGGRGLAAATLALVLVYMAYKKYSFLPLPDFVLGMPEVVGISYIVFRAINVLVDVKECGGTFRTDFVSYLNYCLSFCTLLAGPLQRYKDFQDDLRARAFSRLGEAEATEAFRRIANGLFKALLVAAAIFSLHSYFASGSEKAILGLLLRGYKEAALYFLSALSYLAFLYFNFSGYSDIAVGLGALLGFRLPENFDRPFNSANFLEFWSRWHMSLSFWFRDYVFNPLVMLLIRRWPRASLAKYHAVLAYFLTFFLLGVWHGRTTAFLFCGFTLATGSSVNKLFQLAAQKRLGAAGYRKLCTSAVLRRASIGLSCVWISVAISGLWLPWEGMRAVLANGAPRTLGVAFLGACLAAAAVVPALRGLSDFSAGLATRLRIAGMRPATVQIVIALQILAVCIFTLLEYKAAPPFVYQAF